MRWWAAGASAICLGGVAALIGAGPTTAPMAATPATSPSVAAATPAPPARQSDPSSENRGGRNVRGRGRNGGNSSGATPVAAAGGDPYAILQQRSIFIKGNQTTTPPSADSRRESARDTGYSARPPNLLIFNGVTVINDKPEAFVEDLGSNVVGTVRIGDAVAGGTVLAINFDDLAYEVRGQTRHVGLGQNFNGDSAFALSAPAATTTTAAAPASPGQIVGAGASIPAAAAQTASGLSSEDIIARMKAKRAQEEKSLGVK